LTAPLDLHMAGELKNTGAGNLTLRGGTHEEQVGSLTIGNNNLAMTGGQAELGLAAETSGPSSGPRRRKKISRKGLTLVVQPASAEELAAHEAILDRLDQASGGCLWRRA
jgi:DNA polymerase-3 subunit epsilon